MEQRGSVNSIKENAAQGKFTTLCFAFPVVHLSLFHLRSFALHFFTIEATIEYYTGHCK